jgi:hypothetical protein
MHSFRLAFLTCLLGAILAVACVQPAAAADGLDIDVGVTATPEASSTWIWSIDKWADRSTLTIEFGQEAPVNYSVTVDVCCANDEYLVSGEIFITNNGPGAITINAVDVTISPGIPADSECEVFALELDEAETLTCPYSAVLPDDSARTVNVDVTANGVPGHTGSIGFDFTGVSVEELDECVDVLDDWEGYLGTACAIEAPVTFYYTRMIGGCTECGYRLVCNNAYFTTNDTRASACSSWCICVLTPCEDGCTRTQGYWKTHSEHGPAPYDATWAELDSGADTPFFLSGQSYVEVLWTAPKKGNAYYILAHQWIAAYLNVLSGASIPDNVLNAWLEAEDLFETYTPTEIAALKSTAAAGEASDRARSRLKSQPTDGGLRRDFIDLAGILGMYNEGYVGPGHCPD